MISIVIPCYKQAEYLSDAIESALDQTVKPHEIIVVNDGSPDNTKEVAERYPVKVINQANKGLASARNTGIMNAMGDYILPLDADDMLLPQCIEKMESCIKETNADVIACSFKMFGINNDAVILQQVPFIDAFKSANRIGYFSAIKKSVLLEVGGYSPRMTQGWEDWHLWFDIFKRGKSLALIHDILVLYRTKENSMIHNADAHAPELWRQILTDHHELF